MRAFVICAAALSLSNCATIRGSQDMVPELSPQMLVPVETALRNFHLEADTDRDGMSRIAYRNYILSSYQSAIDSRYRRFTDQLRSSDRGSALALDLLVLGLTGATALAGMSDIHELATITTVAVGARATIDERLFFDRTLPAIIASMDAERTVIKTEIAQNRRLSAERYSLDEAVGDLHRLQQAGRLDRAFARITRIAEADRAEQQARLDAITAACDNITQTSAALNQSFRQLVYDDPNTRDERLAAAAEALGMELPEGTTATWLAVADRFDRELCDDAEKRSFIEALRSELTTETGGNDGQE